MEVRARRRGKRMGERREKQGSEWPGMEVRREGRGGEGEGR